jgi:lipoprotein-anchoring transpeptidase ErfK/SrfK
MRIDFTQSRQARSGALVLLAATGLLAGMTAAPAQAVEEPPEATGIGVAVEPVVEPDPNAAAANLDNPAAAVDVSSVPPPVEATALSARARSATRSKDVVTKIRPNLTPGGGRKLGVAQVVTMRFPVEVNRKANVERAIKVSGYKTKNKRKSVKLPSGRWGWVDGRTAVYRPKKFWPGDTTIKFQVKLGNVLIAKHGQVSYIGGSGSNQNYSLRTARKFVLRISNKSHRLSVMQNGKRINSFGVSLGKSNYQTRSGTKVLTDTKYRNLRMQGTDRYSGATWDVVSPYSMPLTTNGEYIHGAPWARHRIGRANGSHGCTNMNPEDAKWLFYRVRKGDPVVTTGTGRKMSASLAFTEGKPWSYSWRQWRQKSSL